MNILVATDNDLEDADLWDCVRALEHEVVVGRDRTYNPHAIVCMSITQMPALKLLIGRHPRVPMFMYNWDTYSWAVDGNVRYDYEEWMDLCAQAREVWVPSECTGTQLDKYTYCKWHRILAYVNLWDAEPRDRHYALCPLRKIPDRDWDMLEHTTSIPLFMSHHTLEWIEYQRRVANCTFLVSHCAEMSTGGLSLLEGYALGKPVLLSDSPLHGGRDYFGERANYFEAGNRESLKDALERLYSYPAPLDRVECRRWVETEYSAKRFAKDLVERICLNL